MLIFPYTVYNLFTNMAMSTNIIYPNFIFKDMPIRAFILRGVIACRRQAVRRQTGLPVVCLHPLKTRPGYHYRKALCRGCYPFVSVGILRLIWAADPVRREQHLLPASSAACSSSRNPAVLFPQRPHTPARQLLNFRGLQCGSAPEPRKEIG